MVARVKIDTKAFKRAYGEDIRYQRYMRNKGDELRKAMIEIFLLIQRSDNEWRLSETTPPKYINSFEVYFGVADQILTVTNTDPAWHFVEWGAHPGGDPDTFVLAYKPMTRGLLTVAAKAV